MPKYPIRLAPLPASADPSPVALSDEEMTRLEALFAPGNAETLRRYWTTGEGAAKIRWGTSGDFTRCVKNLRKYIPNRTEGYCANLHHRALGYWPGEKGKPGNPAAGDTVVANALGVDLGEYAEIPELMMRGLVRESFPGDAMGGEMPIHGVLATEGSWTGDGRIFDEGALRWDFSHGPMPFRWSEFDWGQHDGARHVGWIDDARRVGEDVEFIGRSFDPAFCAYLDRAKKAGVSIDADEETYDVLMPEGGLKMDENPEPGKAYPQERQREVYHDARIRGATAVDIPAFISGWVMPGHPVPATEGKPKEPAVGTQSRTTDASLVSATAGSFGDFDVLHAPAGSSIGGQFISPGESKTGEKTKPGEKPAKPKSNTDEKPKLSKAQREARLVKAILDALDDLLNQLTGPQAQALIKQIQANAEAFVEGAMRNEKSGGSGGGKSKGGGSSLSKPDKAAGAADKSGSEKAESGSGGSEGSGGGGLPAGAAGIIKGVQRLLEKRSQNMKPTTRRKLEDAVKRLDGLVAAVSSGDAGAMLEAMDGAPAVDGDAAGAATIQTVVDGLAEQSAAIESYLDTNPDLDAPDSDFLLRVLDTLYGVNTEAETYGAQVPGLTAAVIVDGRVVEGTVDADGDGEVDVQPISDEDMELTEEDLAAVTASVWRTVMNLLETDGGQPGDGVIEQELTHAGILLVADDTGRWLMLQRALEDGDENGGLWEFPGGALEDGESSYEAAQREFAEETGSPLPGGAVPAGSLISPSGNYELNIAVVPSEADYDIYEHEEYNPDDPDGDRTEALAWWDPEHVTNGDGYHIRPEVKNTDWARVKEILDMHGQSGMTAAAEDLDMMDGDPATDGATGHPDASPVGADDARLLERLIETHQQMNIEIDDFLKAHPDTEIADELNQHKAESADFIDEAQAQLDVSPTEDDALVASVASGLLAPPDEWFNPFDLGGPTPITITADGRIYGHLAEWGSCHRNPMFQAKGKCIPPPSDPEPEFFYSGGQVITASGAMLEVGRLTVGGGHATVDKGIVAALEHYDDVSSVGGIVRVFEDEYGIGLFGSVVADATPEQVAAMRRSPFSGDWRKERGQYRLIAAHAVNTGGYPVPRSSEPLGMVASVTPSTMILTGRVERCAECGDEKNVDPIVASLLVDALSEGMDAEVGAMADALVASITEDLGYDLDEALVAAMEEDLDEDALMDVSDVEVDAEDEPLTDKDRQVLDALAEHHRQILDLIGDGTGLSSNVQAYLEKTQQEVEAAQNTIEDWEASGNPGLMAAANDGNETGDEISSAEREKAAEKGEAMPDGSYPIRNCQDLHDAVQSIGRAKDPAAVKRHIKKRAGALDCPDFELPEGWAGDTTEIEGA